MSSGQFLSSDYFKGIFKKISWVFIFKILSVFVAFLSSMMVSRSIGAEGVGALGLSLSIVGFLTVLSKVGLEAYLVKEASSACLGRSPPVTLLVRSLFLSFFVSLFIITIMFLGGRVFFANIFSEENIALVLNVLIFYLLIYSVNSLLLGFLRGLGHQVFSEFSLGLLPGMIRLCLVLFGLIVGIDLYYMGFVYLMSAMVVFVITLFKLHGVCYSFKVSSFKLKTSLLEYFDLARRGGPFLIVAGMSVVAGSVDMLMLGWLVDVHAVGVYSVVFNVSSFLLVVMTAANSVVSREFASTNAVDIYKLRPLFQRVRFVSIFVLIPVAIMFILYAESILSWWGADFVSGRDAFVVLVVGRVLEVSLGGVGVFLMMTGDAKLVRNTTVLSLLLNVFLNYLLVRDYSEVGAAAATIISMLFAKIYLLNCVHKKMILSAGACE